MLDLSLIRSLLFTPADRPDRLPHGLASRADGVILDLEDGVGLPHKAEARKAALAFFADPLKAPPGFVWAVRPNHVTTEPGLADDARVVDVVSEGLDHIRFLLRLAELELIERERRMVERRIKEARFPAVKSQAS
jgi:citrate lyase beta subunit